MENYIYINNTSDYSVLSAAVATGYYFKNPVDSSSDYYSNTAESVSFTQDTFTQSFSGYLFDSSKLVYKRSTVVNLSAVKYSEFNTIVYNLSGINDSNNTIVKVVFEPLSGVYQTVTYNGESLEFDKGLPYNFAIGGNTDNNPKNVLYPYDYVLNDDDGNEKTFTSRFSAYRQDGLVDEYIIDILISRDSVYNISEKINLLDSQTLPLSSKDPVVKIELENPNYVNNFVIRRFVSPTPTRTITPSQTSDATPTRTPTPTFTRTRSQTPTATRTKTTTRTRSNTPTQTRTKSQSPTRNVTSTRTVSPSYSRSILTYVAPTPPPSPAPICNSKEILITYKGLNNAIEPSTVTLGLRYKINGVIYSFGSQLENVTGENTLKIYVPRDYSNYNLEPFVHFTSDDPIITVTNWVTNKECSIEEVSTFNPPAIVTPPTAEPPPVEEPPVETPREEEPLIFTPPVEPINVPDNPPTKSVFSFGFGQVTESPIKCQLNDGVEAVGDIWNVNIKVEYIVFTSSLSQEKLEANVTSPVDNTYRFELPVGGTRLDSGTFEKRVNYLTIPLGEPSLPLGSPIETTTLSIDDSTSLNTESTYIIFKQSILNEINDYDNYLEWIDNSNWFDKSACSVLKNWDYDKDETQLNNFIKFIPPNGGLPVAKAPNDITVNIQPLISYQQWEKDKYPFTHLVTRS